MLAEMLQKRALETDGVEFHTLNDAWSKASLASMEAEH
jgi:hypothetical protein